MTSAYRLVCANTYFHIKSFVWLLKCRKCFPLCPSCGTLLTIYSSEHKISQRKSSKAVRPLLTLLLNMSSECLDREFLDDDPMPLGATPELDENVINNSLINLSNDAFTLSQPNTGNHNKNFNLKGKQNSKNAILRIFLTPPPPPPPHQSKIHHISNKPNHNPHESLSDNRYSVHNKGPHEGCPISPWLLEWLS